LLKVTGTFSLAQFWPVGEPDADTSKVIVKLTVGGNFHEYLDNNSSYHCFLTEDFLSQGVTAAPPHNS